MNQTLRFKVFQRDSFICQYCGQKPPKVILEADHIIPKSKKGRDDIENLITSCFDCNRGKGKRELTDIPETVKNSLQDIKERKTQLKEFYKYQEQIEVRDQTLIDDLIRYWEDLWDGRFTLNTRGSSGLRRFLKDFGVGEMKEAMGIAVGKMSYSQDVEKAIRYFYGIMNVKLKNKNFNG